VVAHLASDDGREECTLKKTTVVIWAVAALTGMVMAANAQVKPATSAVDPRVETALREAKLGYAVDDGDFMLDYNVADGRTQRVWVASKAAKITTLEFRDVWSVAYRGTGQVPAELARRLLAENVRMVLGAWQLNQSADEYLVVFLAPIAADADAATLQEVIEAVTLSADRMEKELTGKNEF
jgi:hypothetical protein